MLPHQALIPLLARGYGLAPAAVEPPAAHEPDRAVFVVTAPDGGRRVARLLRRVAALPPWVAAPDPAAWLDRQAALLGQAAAAGVAAPPVIPARDGRPIAAWGDWLALLTGYVEGAKLPDEPGAHAAAAELAAGMHRRGRERGAGWAERLPPSWWAAPARARASALIDGLAEIPAEWAPLFVRARAALAGAAALDELPATLIHGDCWAGNLLLLPDGSVGLIDWEHAGRGAALLDLGSLLSDCWALEGESPAIRPGQIAAIAAGYARQRPLGPGEPALLGDAIAFGAAFRTAVRGWLAGRYGWPALARGLLREQRRLSLAPAIAEQAAGAFAAAGA